MIDKLLHLVLPRESNNHKAKLLHSSSLIGLTLLFIAYQFTVKFAPRIRPAVLGYAANISVNDVITLTNQKRVEAGLAPLSTNSILSEAAQAKGEYMIKNNFWAHVAPDGTTPWQFFLQYNYKYRYAGENLAKNFSNANDAVNAWMNSPSHRENLLSANYKDIGIGVVEGNIDGVDTTIIVQFFGTRYADIAPNAVAQIQPSAAAATAKPTINPTLKPSSAVLTFASPVPTVTPALESLTPSPTQLPTNIAGARVLISPFVTTKGISLVLVAILLGLLAVDVIIISRRRIARIGGRSIAHMAFLGMILAVAIILKAGQII